MKIALLGYGKMGKAIEKIAIERGHEIGLKIDSNNSKSLNINSFIDIDVAIDFSIPTTAQGYIKMALKSQTPIISGTTGWLEAIESVKNLCISQNSAFLYASNFSLGVNLFFELNKNLAKLMSKHTNYNISMEEIHHVQKLDAPSGTAITLAEQIISSNQNKTNWILNEAASIEEIPIEARRENKVPGTHIVTYQSEIDSLSITHEAHSRKGFALGAVIASEWILNKKGIFSMKDVLFSD
jgi:4-hydroxy-tetrahydrodipicolinate reductase